MDNNPFTDEKMITKMLDMWGEKSYDIDATILEPTCGVGNFLVEALKRKFQTIELLYNNEQDYETAIYRALSSMKGIDIIQDCVETTKQRLGKIVTSYYEKHFDKKLNSKYKVILNRNIINKDILQYNTNKHFNIIIGNPPYWIDKKPVYKDILKKISE